MADKMTNLTEETKTLVTLIRHQRQVSYLLRELARELERRADSHDLSKLQLDEFEGFVEVNRIVREYQFGSKEYADSLRDNKAIELHFSRNPHHPEYHPNEMEDMGFVDFLEMVIDWIAANQTYGTTKWADAIAKQQQRFVIMPWRLAVIEQIAEWFGVK